VNIKYIINILCITFNVIILIIRATNKTDFCVHRDVVIYKTTYNLFIMNELPDDLIHSEYFIYRSQLDLLNEHYEDLLDDLSSFLGNPYYKLLTIGSLEGNLFFYWEGPFSKAPHKSFIILFVLFLIFILL